MSPNTNQSNGIFVRITPKGEKIAKMFRAVICEKCESPDLQYKKNRTVCNLCGHIMDEKSDVKH